jgi:peptide/nickel transport system substrate-binding protein
MQTTKQFCCFAVLAAIASLAQAETVVRWANQSDALTLDPHAYYEGTTINLLRQMYDPLIRLTPQLELEPALATSWTQIDPTTWEFKLREGVRFHDGAEFNAEDVVFSLQRVTSSETSNYKSLLSSITGSKAVDDYTVHVTTQAPNPILPNLLIAVFMMDKGWAEQHNAVQPQDLKAETSNYATLHVNGTGPFMLQEREQDARTVMIKNPAWWDQQQHPLAIDKLVFTPIPNAATRTAALLSGELDLVLDAPVQDLQRIAADPDLKVQSTHQLRTVFLGIEQGAAELHDSNIKGKNPLSDKRVRQALYQAIDIDTIHDKVMQGQSKPAGMLAAPGVRGYSEQLSERLPYDPAAAKQLLADAGYADGFDLLMDCPNDAYVNDEKICQSIVSMLSKTGLNMTLNAEVKSKFFQKLDKYESDFHLLSLGNGSLDSQEYFKLNFTSKATWNTFGYRNPRVDELVDNIEVETDSTQRDAMTAEVWQIIKDDIVYIPLHYQMVNWAMNKKLELPISAQGSTAFYLARMNNS